MTDRVAIVTGGLRGLGRAMALGLVRSGVRVLAVGHIDSDIPEMQALLRADEADRLDCLVADIRKPAECDRVLAACLERFSRVDILVNSAGLTFTYIWPDRFRRDTPQKFWEAKDAVIQAVMDTNYVAADQMTRRVAPLLVQQGWGRIVSVTTKLDTMNRIGTTPYGASKAALEMATEVWAKELAGTGVTANIVNPGAGANTPGMAQEMRDWSREGKAPRLVEAEEMVPPLLYVASAEADAVNGYRFDANTWDTALPPTEAARRNARPAGFVLHPQDAANWPG
ncbi:MAG TPA: SDR family NAD(P)-dependent oxidoreductase [Acetobacteraceae bacterium]|nr:SDR family NAD(P)-dependent oxidoreductase [Acetobacteraceae bacterium]